MTNLVAHISANRVLKCKLLWQTVEFLTFRVKVKVKVKFTLEQGTKAYRGSRGIAILFLKP